MGQAGTDFAQVQAKIEDDLARTNADNLYLSASTAANDAVNDLKTKMGKGALDHRPIAGKAVEDALASTLAQADQRTRHYLEPQLARLRASADNEMSSYAVQQGRVYQQETGKAKVENAFQMAVSSDDPAKRAGFIQEIRDQTRVNLDLAGLTDPDIVEAEERKVVSGTHAAITQRYLSAKDYDMADAYYQANKSSMTVGDQASLSASLAAPMLKRWAEQKFTALTVLPSVGAEPGKGGSGNPVADGGAAIKALFPGVAITSTYRAPDHPLSKANPKSWHTKSHAAVDIKPIAGMTFDQYVKQVEGAGYTVLEAIDEVGAGRSKHATGDHWHIVLGKGGGAGQAPGARRWDLEAVTQGIYSQAEKEGWSIEQRDAVLDVAKDRISLDEQMKRRNEEDADRSASEWVLKQGAGFTDISQMPPSIRNALSPDAARSYIGVAKSNAKPKAVEANGPRATDLELARIRNPEEFAKIPLGKFATELTPAELQSLLIEQEKIKKGDPEKSIRSKVASTINTFGVDDGLTGQDDDKGTKRRQRVAVQKIMEGELRALTGGKRNPTDDELYKAYQSATRDVTYRTVGFFGGAGSKTKRRFELSAEDVPEDRRLKIIAGYRQTYGRDPTNDEIGEIFRNGKGRYW
ncbi:M23 family peptidase [Sphingobium yanoikuyae]|uniref:M23 family peptidase n=1 Tax=Sphingobium yanoikuyae TaxID=13690 RepID=UPI002FDC7A9C